MTSTAPASAPPRDPSAAGPLSVVPMTIPDPALPADPPPTDPATDPAAADPTAAHRGGGSCRGGCPTVSCAAAWPATWPITRAWSFTPGQIARALSARSSGAVANALVVLAGLDAAEHTGERPTRFRATPGSATIAAAPPIIGTGPSPSPPRPRAAHRVGCGRVRSRPAAPTGPGAVARIGLAAAPSTDPVVDPVTGAVLRPNGQAYHPRQLADGSGRGRVAASCAPRGCRCCCTGRPGPGRPR